MDKIREKLTEIVGRIFGVSDFEPEVTVAPGDTGADFASNVAMQLAGRLHRAPREVAEEIIAELPSDFPFSATIAGPGFINFISSDEYFERKLTAILEASEEGFADFNSSHDIFSGKTVVCEFSDPNPFKVLHVGHLYTSIVGDAIARLVEFAGGRVIRANFGGDVGLHVAKTLYAARKHRTDMENVETIAECYVEGTRAYEDEPEAKAEIVELNKEIYRIAREDVHEGELAEMYWTGREASYRYFEEFYARVGVKFDKYYPESAVAGRGLTEVLAQVPAVYEKSGEAVIFPGEKYGLHTRVFVNAEGLPTYEAKDVGLLFTKWDDYHFDESIVITGNDIIDYMKVVLKSVSMYAPELAERTRHVTHGNVRLPGNEKMSSRKGNFVRAVDVLDEVSGMVSDSQIAIGAIKYAFLKYRIGGNIEFNAKESVSTTGNSGVYLQYSAVRAKKIITKVKQNVQFRDTCPAGPSPRAAGTPTRAAALRQVRETEDSASPERNLIREVIRYPEVLTEAVRELAPHKVATYLYEVSQEFSRFYEKVKVVGSEAEAERVRIVRAYYKVMEHGLGLLGITIPEEM